MTLRWLVFIGQRWRCCACKRMVVRMIVMVRERGQMAARLADVIVSCKGMPQLCLRVREQQDRSRASRLRVALALAASCEYCKHGAAP
jgi:hypothetical protein